MTTRGTITAEFPVDTRYWTPLAWLGVGLARVRVAETTSWVLVTPLGELTLAWNPRP